MHNLAKTCLVVAIALLRLLSEGTVAVAAPDGELRLEILDSKTRQPLPVRVRLTRDRGRKFPTRGIGVGALGDHFYLPGSVTLGLRRGTYLFSLDAGTEYRTQSGDFEIKRHADDSKTIEMRRFANLGDEGWFAGDLDATRSARDLPIMAAAEGLDYVSTIAWHYERGKWQSSHATVRKDVDASSEYADGRYLGAYTAFVELAGGSLLLVSDSLLEKPPFEIEPDATSLGVIESARREGMRVVAATPTAWDLPVWIASGQLDALCLLTRQNEDRGVADQDPNGRQRDKTFYPGKQGLARWGQAIYFHLLNAGVRLSPVAGSGSGSNNSPLGTNRTYVYVPSEFSGDAWWKGIDRGSTVITNGPLVRPSVGGDSPGTVFAVNLGETIDFRIAMNLASRTPVEYLEIIKDGQVDAEVRLSDWASKGGQLPPVSFDQSGWFAVRAATSNRNRYQFALTAPYYVESPNGPRISRASVEFFLFWLDELQQRGEKQASSSSTQIETAREWWNERLRDANAK